MSIRITRALFENFPPFKDSDIVFDEVLSAKEKKLAEVHFLTGENGTGKTRLLCLLAAACGNSTPLDARWPSTQQNKSLVLMKSLNNNYFGFVRNYFLTIKNGGPENFGPGGPGSFGGLHRALINENELDYLKSFKEFQSRHSHRTIHQIAHVINELSNFYALAFKGNASISDAKIQAMAPIQLGEYVRQLSFEPFQGKNEILCQAIANLKLQSAMDLMQSPGTPTRPQKIMQKLETAISKITQRTFNFNVQPNPELRLTVKWGNVETSLSLLPDGLRSIIGWLVYCVASLDLRFPQEIEVLDMPFIMLLDEPELHLHPAWQRKILPAAQMLFPNAQIFVATHSPFVISSVNEGWIHCFRADENSVVSIDKAIPCERGDSWIEVVENILGVREWFDPETEELLIKFRAKKDEVNKEPQKFTEFKTMAESIGQRGETLNNMMMREIRQMEMKLNEIRKGIPA